MDIRDTLMIDLNSTAREFHNPPPADAILWRYMDFTKFVSLLETRTLFLARADKLGDPFEGSVPKNNLILRATLESEFSDEEILKYTLVMQQLPRFTLISCWHESSYESEAMWRLYASVNGGIAIKSNFNVFAKSFLTAEQIHIGAVQYVDYDNDQIPEDDLLSPYLHKRQSFKYEQEVRAIVQYLPTGLGRTELRDSIPNISKSEIDRWPDICDIGIDYEVDLNLLIQEVVVSHFAPDWLLDLVKSVTKRYELEAPINKSRLAESPMW